MRELREPAPVRPIGYGAPMKPLALPVALALALAFPSVDDADDLKDKDPLVRLATVQRLAEAGGEDASKLLPRALDDEDWEVALVAAEALGRHGDEGDVKALAALAWEGPVAPLRAAAARSAARLDPTKALAEVAKKLTGARLGPAARAWAAILTEATAADPGFTPKVPKALTKGLKSKDLLARAAAAHALVLGTRDDDDRAELLVELFELEHTALHCAALDAAALDPRASQVAPLEDLLRRPDLPDVTTRRALGALAASLTRPGAPPAREVVTRLTMGVTVDPRGLDGDGQLPAHPRVGPRGSRLAEACLANGSLAPDELLPDQEPAFAKQPAARAAAARALGVGPRAAVHPRLAALVVDDASARVRRAALAALLAVAPVATRTEADEETGQLPPLEVDAGQLDLVAAVLADDADPVVREDAAVALGLEGLDDAAPALVAALADPAWGVAACAAVSLGRTRAEAALAPLVTLTGHDDWRLRGAAAMGLAHLMRKPGVPALIDLLEDTEPLVVRTAHAVLRSINRGAPLPPEAETWRDWWAEAEKRTRLETPAEARARRAKLGYAASPTEIYAGLDVVVFQSRGDHMETVLDHLGILHRRTSSGGVPGLGLDGGGVFVSNCTGEMQAGDVERLAWFVRVGGYLFGSCWAVSETVQKVAPGHLRQLPTRGEVLDQVTAAPCAPDSPYLDGVFAPGVVPIYHLVGAHLIEVLTPERVEVLIDSPECAERWGDGNLAAWFRMGHGRILDSVNHFDAQGLAQAEGLKKPEDRQAYAVDHMGLSLTRLRATRDEGWWKSGPAASEEVRDLSAFGLITNFVRARRLEGY